MGEHRLTIDSKTVDLFPVPLGVVNLGESSRQLNRETMEAVYKLMDTEKRKYRTGKGVFQTQTDLHERSTYFSSLNDFITDLSNSYAASIGFRSPGEYLRLNSLWFNYNDSPSGFHTPHIHGSGGCMFSGIYYPTSGVEDGVEISDSEDLDLPLNINYGTNPEPGSIVFMDPSLAARSAVLSTNISVYPYYTQIASFKPRAGSFLFFPNYLTHYVTPTAKERFERVSVVFTFSKKKN